MLQEGNEEDDVGYWQAAKSIIKYSIPSMFMILIQSGVLLMNYVFLGIKTNEPSAIAAWGLGFTSVNIISKYLSWGLWDGMDWLVSQAYGRKDFKLWKLYLNMWRYSILFVSLIQSVAFVFLEKILIFLHQPADVSFKAWEFWLMIFPATIFFNLFECNRRYLVWCQISNPNAYINIIAILVHIILLFFLTVFWNLSIFGIGISTFITYFLSFTALEIYNLTFNERVHQAKWIFFNLEMLKELWLFWKVCIPCWGIILFHWIPVVVAIFFSGTFGVNQLTSVTIINSIKSIAEEAYFGFGLSNLAHVGNSLGENHPNKAKIYALISLLLSFVFILWITFINIAFQDFIIFAYTDDKTVIGIIKSVYIFFLLHTMFSCEWLMTLSILIVWGYRKFLMIMIIICYWVSLPSFTYIFAIYLEYKFEGLQ